MPGRRRRLCCLAGAGIGRRSQQPMPPGTLDRRRSRTDRLGAGCARPTGGLPVKLCLFALLVAVAAVRADDRQIAFVKDNDIHLARFDGADPVRLTTDPRTPRRQLVWSFDGERLAYVQERKDGEATVRDIYLVSVSVPTPRMVVDGAQLEAPGHDANSKGAWSPALEPTGQFLYFLSGGDETGGGLMRVDLTAAQFPAEPQAVATNRPLHTIAFTGDGRLVGSYRPAYPEGGQRSEVCVAPAEKWDEFTDITAPTDFDNPGGDYAAPAWSPDGKLLAAIHVPRDDICLFDLAAKTHRLFVDGDALDRLDITQVAWRPDAKGVYFSLFDKTTGRPHSIWYAPLRDSYDRELIALQGHSIAAGGSAKLRRAARR